MILAALVATAPIFYAIFKSSKNDAGLDTKVSGSITLFAEDSCKPLTEALVKAFQQASPQANFELKSGPGKDAFEALKKDTSRLVVMPRELTEAELMQFRAAYFVPQKAVFAKSANGNPVTLFNNQARQGLGASFMAFVTSEAGNEVVRTFGLEPVTKKTRLMKPTRKVA